MYWPGTNRFTRNINNNQFVKCHITSDDVHTREHVYGTRKPLLRGTMTRKTPNKHNRANVAPLTRIIPTRYLTTDLFMDILFVNGNNVYTPNVQISDTDQYNHC